MMTVAEDRSPIVLGACVLLFCACLLSLRPAVGQILTKEDLQRELKVYEEASKHADPPAMEPLTAGRVWSRLGTLYEDAGRYYQAEMAFRHGLRLLETAPASEIDLAQALDGIGTVYLARGDTQQAEQAERRALELREKLHQPMELLKSYDHLATLYLRKRRWEMARDYAAKAVAEVDSGHTADPDGQINALLVLGMSLCRLQQYPQAIETVGRATHLIQASYGEEDFPSGYSKFLLGYVYWKSGNLDSAEELLHRGAEIVHKQMSWDHPVYVSMMAQYASFLRDRHEKKEARVIEDQVRQARSRMGTDPGQFTVGVNSFF